MRIHCTDGRLWLVTRSGCCLRAIGFIVAAVLGVSIPRVVWPHSLEQVYAEAAGAVVIVRARESAWEGKDQPYEVILHSQGSGVIIFPDGTILTSAHLVQSADEIVVKFSDGSVAGARVKYSEPAADVALLVVDRLPEGVAVASLGDSDELRVGQEILVIGSPYGVGGFLSVGHVSARHPAMKLSPGLGMTEFFQTDALIAGGFSGGPVFDLNGAVVGIASHVLGPPEYFSGFGFVITVNTAKSLLLERKSVWTGIRGHWLTGKTGELFNVAQPRALLVERVADDSLGGKLGLREGHIDTHIDDEQLTTGGDIILAIQGISLADMDGYEQAMQKLAALDPGTPITMLVQRGGAKMELSVIPD